ncbi:transposase [Clostridium gasigenes]|uniref:Transposase n=1 Tax=Clostridium gasigenes TaxID=94869 RepID=A0A7X0SG05_9CLOT|nr:transposase [Clostridium gasigenes]MBB6716839.1 transposase [Clostridium gasigenes]
MYLANMVALAKMDANEIIEKEYTNKGLKYESKVNTNVLIDKLKDTLITMISLNNPWKRLRMLKHIEEEILKNIIPIRPDRIFKRKVHSDTQMVNRMNKKRAL